MRSKDYVSEGTHVYMEAEDLVSSWRLNLGSDRGTAGNAGLMSCLVKVCFFKCCILACCVLTANTLIAKK